VLHGHDAIRSFYSDLFVGFPDFWLDIPCRRVTHDAVYVEGFMGGTHLGPWAGIEPTGRKIRIPICAVFTFTEDDRIRSETAYYDRLAILEQLGVAAPANHGSKLA
jgi:predicted ester cyclase